MSLFLLQHQQQQQQQQHPQLLLLSLSEKRRDDMRSKIEQDHRRLKRERERVARSFSHELTQSLFVQCREFFACGSAAQCWSVLVVRGVQRRPTSTASTAASAAVCEVEKSHHFYYYYPQWVASAATAVDDRRNIKRAFICFAVSWLTHSFSHLVRCMLLVPGQIFTRTAAAVDQHWWWW